MARGGAGESAAPRLAAVEAAEQALELRVGGAGSPATEMEAAMRGENRRNQRRRRRMRSSLAVAVSGGGGSGVSRKKREETGSSPSHRILIGGVCGLVSVSTRVEDRRTPRVRQVSLVSLKTS
jgi:hypothetical protein